MDYATACRCARQLEDNGVEWTEVLGLLGTDKYEVVVYRNTDSEYTPLFSIQAYSPLIEFSLP